MIHSVKNNKFWKKRTSRAHILKSMYKNRIMVRMPIHAELSKAIRNPSLEGVPKRRNV